MTDLSRAVWRKAARSGAQNGGCVEIAGNLPGITAIRDSKRPDDGALTVPKTAFATFLTEAKAGHYDI
jgi:hypothetical protein